MENSRSQDFFQAQQIGRSGENRASYVGNVSEGAIWHLISAFRVRDRLYDRGRIYRAKNPDPEGCCWHKPVVSRRNIRVV